MTAHGTLEAESLEAEAAEWPDQRGEILLEAAAAWRRSGDRERAIRLLVELAAAGGEDGCYARCELVDDCFRRGDVAAAADGLALLARDPALHDGHCQLVAEMLVERGDLDGAAGWYDRAVARLAPETIAALRGPDGWAQLSAVVVLRGRRQLRRRLGLPLDAMDQIVPAPPGRPPISLDDVAEQAAAGRVPRQVRMMVFQRLERAEARRRWPDVYDCPDEEYYPAAERRWRELAASGVPAIRVIPVTVVALSAFADEVGASPTDSAVRARFSATAAERDSLLWPPPRNGPCWCGAAMKYKKCCGRVV
ncbi:MAG: SEC-C domain-containing protein [Mycobacteriales bacterium]